MAGAFYPPPPVFIGGAQPYAPRLGKAQSGPAPQPPPISGPMVAATFALLIGSWTPGPQPAQGSPRFVRPPPQVISPPPVKTNALSSVIRSTWELPFVLPQVGADIAPLLPAPVISPHLPAANAVLRLIVDAWVDRSVTVITTTAIASVSAAAPVGPGAANNAPYLTIRAAWDVYTFPVQLFGGLDGVAPLIPAQAVAQIAVNQIPYRVIRQAWEPAVIAPQVGATIAPLLPAPPAVSQPQPLSFAALYSLARAWDPPVWWPLPKLAQMPQSGQPAAPGPLPPQRALLRLLLQSWDATVQPQQDIGFVYSAAPISAPPPALQAILRLLLQSWDVGIQPTQDVPFVFPAIVVPSAPPPTNQALTRLLAGAWDLTAFISQRQPVVTANGPVPQAPPVRTYANLNLIARSWVPAPIWPNPPPIAAFFSVGMPFQTPRIIVKPEDLRSLKVDADRIVKPEANRMIKLS
jgi:hypothetical protein